MVYSYAKDAAQATTYKYCEHTVGYSRQGVTFQFPGYV
jgi:hypothetical protein